MREVAFIGASSSMSGVEFSTLYLAQQLDRSDWLPVVICPEEGELPERCRALGIRVDFVQVPRFFSTSVRIAGFVIINPFAVLIDGVLIVVMALRLYRFLRKLHPELVVPKGLLAQFYGGLAACWTGIPCVWHIQDRVSTRLGQLFPLTMSLAGRLLARQVIVDAQSIAWQLTPTIPSNRVHVIWNGVDTREFSPQVDGACVRTDWEVQPSHLLIGAIARLIPWKGQHVLIEAFARIADQFPDARVVLVGSALFDTDAYARGLQVKAIKYGVSDRVIFAGYRRDIPQVLAALDVIVHPALEKDSSPLAVVSAMAAGKAIICSNLEGTAELFDEGIDGLLVPPGDVNALSEKLVLLLREVDLRRKLGSAARQKAEASLSIERFTQRCEAVFERALK